MTNLQGRDTLEIFRAMLDEQKKQAADLAFALNRVTASDGTMATLQTTVDRIGQTQIAMGVTVSLLDALVRGNGKPQEGLVFIVAQMVTLVQTMRDREKTFIEKFFFPIIVSFFTSAVGVAVGIYASRFIGK